MSDYKRLLECLSTLPKHIVNHHERENLSELVLHGLCSNNCFNLKKAAYLIDNPDFNCIKGVTGFNQNESNLDWPEIWGDPDSFSLIVKSSPFNQRVRTFENHSFKKNYTSVQDALHKAANEIGFNDPSFLTWNSKHSNHGFLIFEKNSSENLLDEYLINSLHLLSLCHIF